MAPAHKSSVLPAAVIEALPPIVVGVAILALWEAGCRIFGVPSYLFPTPSAIAHSIVTDVPGLMGALWSTLKVALIALGLAWVGVLVARQYLATVTLSFSVIAIALSVAGVTGVISGFLPAWRAAHMKPVEALRND